MILLFQLDIIFILNNMKVFDEFIHQPFLRMLL